MKKICSLNGLIHGIDGAGREVLLRDGDFVAGEEPGSLHRWFRWMSLVNEDDTIGMIGAGLMMFPALAGITQLDVYEIDPEVIEINEAKFMAHLGWRPIVGDYRKTLSRHYDVLIFDLAEKPDMELLRSHADVVLYPQRPCEG